MYATMFISTYISFALYIMDREYMHWIHTKYIRQYM